ncbi:MAG: ABC transporter permease [Dehalococcoidales bacterium]|nr:ABC transporter permease [Dehalococcoidales bacterium]
MKKWFEPIASAWVGVITHKLRSFLTILGIVIGVGAVIALMSIGRGAQADILSRIQTLGANLVTISPGALNFGGVRSASGSASTLTLEDAAAIWEQVPGLSAMAPTYSTSQQLIFGSANTRSQITGTSPEYQQVYSLQISEGAFFSDYDYQSSARVAVLGANVSETLFGTTTNPIGQTIRVGSNVVRVIGVLAEKGAGMGSPDDAVYIPLTASQQMYAQPRTSQGGHVVSGISLTVADQSSSTVIVEEITSLLRYRHQLSAATENDFRITSIEDIIKTMTETMGTMTLLLGAIAAISLLVGGIGVMNIMLVSVLERTREIGIRKALGAHERDIWSQFLIEAAFLTFAGGIVGVLVGWGASAIVGNMGVVKTLVSADIVLLAVSVSVGIGLFFGFYPAWSASRLDPIEALRSE